MTKMRKCPNCGTPAADGATLCAHCGAAVPPLPTVGGPAPAPGRLMTNVAWLDVVLGVLTTVAATMLFGIGILLAVVAYFTMRASYPSYARGLGIGLAVLGLAFLGLFGVCVYGLSSSGGIH